MGVNLEINLVHYKTPDLGKAWNHYFEFEGAVNVLEGDIFEVKSDAIVSPGNSFGFMDGGLDLQISQRFGWQVQRELQERIEKRALRELLVGESEIITAGDTFIICAPTMRVPTNANIPNSINAYLAAKAILNASRNHHWIKSVSIPGLCTGTGGMSPKVCAKQMYAAYCEVVKGEIPQFPNYMDAKKYHNGLMVSYIQD